MSKRCIINLADTGACESTALMLESAGYRCELPSSALIAELRHHGLENVLDVSSMVKDWGYAEPRLPRTAQPRDMFHVDLFVDTKAHVNYGKIKAAWPSLNVLWRCINGGDPNSEKRRADTPLWANPPCPVLTDNQWYVCWICNGYGEQPWTDDADRGPKPCATCNGSGESRVSYTHFPPYARAADRNTMRSGMYWSGYRAPVCLLHNAERWGYGAIIPILRSACGVKFYGTNSPDGLLPHAEAMGKLAQASFLLHAKIGDTVAYAVIEAIFSLVPVVCTQFYIDECRLHALLEPGKTCLTFDPTNAVESVMEIAAELADPERNLTLARAALARYADLQWRDTEGFAAFLQRHYG